MATPVEKLHYALIHSANQSNTEYLQGLSVTKRDFYLNRAKNWLIPMLARKYGRGSFYDDQISPIVLRDVELEITKGDRFVTAQNPPGSLINVLRVYAIGEHKEGCCEPEIIQVNPKTPDTIDEALRGEFTKPSWPFRYTVSTRAPSGWHVYNGDELVINRVFIDYVRNIPDVRYPVGLQDGNYIDESGQVQTENVDFELDSDKVREDVIRIAGLYALNDMSKLKDFQSHVQEMASLPEIAIR